MKKVLLFVSLLLGIRPMGVGQSTEAVIPNLGKLNFAVPDMPAFKALGTEPSAILRPSTPEALAATASQLYGNGNGVLPRNLALEIAPFILADAVPTRRVPLETYLKRRVLHSLRVSVGTLTDSAVSPYVSKLAAGLRVSLIDRGDLKYDREFLAATADMLRLDALAESQLRQGFNRIHPLTESISQALRDSLFEEYRLRTLTPAMLKLTTARIDSIREDYKRRYWNAEKLDVAVALAGRSPDSLVGNLGFHRLVAWVTWAVPVRRWGQWLIGGTVDRGQNQVEGATENRTQLILSSRLYVGTNRFKGFLEGQVGQDARRSLGQTVRTGRVNVHLGGEFSVFDGVWLQGYAGIERRGTRSSAFTAHLDLRLTLPEKLGF